MTFAFITGTVVCGIIVLISLIVAVLAWLVRTVPDGDNVIHWSVRIFATFVVVFTTGVYLLATWPTFDTQYHRYVPVSGTVTAVSSRFLGADDGSSTQNFVVTMNGQPYRCDDTRCALVKVGDTLSLSCIREYQRYGTPGWRCNYIGDQEATK